MMDGLRFLAVSTMLNIKKFIMMKALWLGLALLFLAVALGGVLSQRAEPIVVIRAGVLYDSSSPLESQIVKFLNESISDIPFVEFIFYDDLDELITDVQLGRLECGYVLNDNIGSVLLGEFSGIVTVVVSHRTIATPVLNDIVAAAILRASVEDVTRDGLIAFFGENDELYEFVEWQFLAYEQMDIFMVPSFAGEYGYAYELAPSLAEITARRILHGLIGLMILILSLFGAGMFIDERAHGLTPALKAHGKLALYDFSLWASAFVAMFAMGIIGLLAMAAFATHLFGSVWSAITALAVYAALCAALFALISRILKDTGLIQSFGLFLVILNIFFGGVLMDLAEINETLAHIQRLFPLFWYIEMAIN